MYSHALTYYQEVFDTLAPHYRIVDLLSLGLADRLRKKAIGKAGIQKGTTVVDIMCGMGNNARHLEPDKNAIRYFGLDISAKMIERARAEFSDCRKTSFTRINILSHGDLFVKGDHILCSYGLKCVSADDIQLFADTVDRLALPGATFSFVEFQLPKGIVMRSLMKLYLNVIYKALCLNFLSSVSPAEALLSALERPLQSERLKTLLIQKGFDVTIEKKLNSAVIFIYGKRN